MTDFDPRSYVEALEHAKNFAPRTGLMDALVAKLVKKGFCVSRQADAWRRITKPEETFAVQLELGEVIQPDTLLCVALNNRVPSNQHFSLYSIEHDFMEIEGLNVNLLDEAVDIIADFYATSLAEASA